MPDSYRVLIVDDDKDALRQIDEHLSELAIDNLRFIVTGSTISRLHLRKLRKHVLT